MTLRTRLKTLEHDKRNAPVADSKAKHRLMQYLQTIADRLPPATDPDLFRLLLVDPGRVKLAPRQINKLARTSQAQVPLL